MGTQYETEDGRIIAKSYYGGADRGPVFRVYCDREKFYHDRFAATLCRSECGGVPMQPIAALIPMMAQTGYRIEWGAEPAYAG